MATVSVAVPIVVANLSQSNSLYSASVSRNADNSTICCVPATIHALKGNSSVVIVGQASSLVGTYFAGHNTYDYRLTVTQYVKGSGPQFLYVETGGSSPQLDIGQSYILFLPAPDSQLFALYCENQCVNPPTPLNQTYPLTSGAAGVFLIRNGMVYDMKTLYPEYSWLEIVVNGVPEDQFISQVRSA